MNIILQVDWDADDIKQYCNSKGYKLNILTYDEIRDIESITFFCHVYFCDTELIQYHLKKCSASFIVPDTYEYNSHYYYGREIKKVKRDSIDSFPIFVKPITNDKLFTGFIAKCKNDLDIQHLLSHDSAFRILLCGTSEKSLEINRSNQEYDLEYVYTSEIVHFESEYRVFMGNNMIYGMGYQKGNKLVTPDLSFLQNICHKDILFKCVDVGYINNRWVIVEINPPFSLDDFGVDIDSYMRFCIDACYQIYCQLIIAS